MADVGWQVPASKLNLLAATTSLRRHLTAEAGSPDRDIGASDHQIEPLLHHCRFGRALQFDQAFVQSVQAPDIVRMLTGSAQASVITEIGPIDRFGLGHVTLLEKERA